MSRTRILIVGAGSAGRSLVQEIRDKQLPVQPVMQLSTVLHQQHPSC